MKILPCPFLHDKNADPRNTPMIRTHKEKHIDSLLYTVQCTHCGAEPDNMVHTEEEAIAWWNSRRMLSKEENDIAHFNEIKILLINQLLNMNK